MWPLLPDVSLTARLDLARDKVARLQVELEEAEDGRTKGRLRRQIDQADLVVATVALQLEQAADLEAEFWAALWATPQATLWESSTAFERILAQFVRWSIKGEQGDLEAAKESRIRYGDYGLTPKSLQALKAEIERVDAAEAARKRRAPAAPSAAGDGKPEEDPRGGLWGQTG